MSSHLELNPWDPQRDLAIGQLLRLAAAGMGGDETRIYELARVTEEVLSGDPAGLFTRLAWLLEFAGIAAQTYATDLAASRDWAEEIAERADDVDAQDALLALDRVLQGFHRAE